MSGFELFIDEIDGRLHAAVLKQGMLWDLYTDPLDMSAAWASLYLGKVTKLDTRLDAAIIDIGNGLSGILPAKHVHLAAGDVSERHSGIADLLNPGQMIMVQIKSEAKHGSEHDQHKLPRLTTKLYTMGQFLLYSPVASQVTVSREIENEKVLEFTLRLQGKGGWIVQTAANYATEEEIETEARTLMQTWQVIQAQRAAGSDDRPRLLKAGPNAAHRAFTDYGAIGFDNIHVASKPLLDMVQDWSEKFYPALAGSKRLRLFRPERPGQKLFEIHDIYSELEILDQDHVYLNCGGSVIIESTHALDVIDVNRGSSDTVAEANMQAALEVARQTRLRNLSGAILVDFINMHVKAERLRLIDAVERSFQEDKAVTQVHGFTRLGIVEITRKRRSATYAEKKKVYLNK